VDTDGDTIPDFRDPDSDDDGLSDADERARGTSPTAADTDGDGVSDLIELAAGTSPLDTSESPLTRGDFVFVVPYERPPAPERDTLQFRTNIQFADIYFLFDRSGSMAGEIGALRGAVGTLMAELTCTDFGTPCARDSDCGPGRVCGPRSTCIEDPAIDACVASPWAGAGWYLENLANVQSLQPDPAATSAALSFGTTGSTERLFRALWQVSGAMSPPSGASGCAPATVGRVGCPAFREEAVKVVVAFTDEDSDGTETAAQAGAAMRALGLRMVGVWSGTPSSSARGSLVDVARASGSLDRAGNPLVFDGADAAVVPAVSRAVREIVEGVPLRATIEARDEPDDAGDALQFIARLEVNVSGVGACTRVAPTEDTDGDGFADAFPALRPGTPVCWDVVARENRTVMPTRAPQVFRALLTVRGDGSPLDTRNVYFLVPPTVPDPGVLR
jgi:hypothetical protein